MSTLHLPTNVMPGTAALLRAVFGMHTVELQQPPLTKLGVPSSFTHMEAALLGVDYVKLLIAGTTKLPVLTLVGDKDGICGLFLIWLREVVGIKVNSYATLNDLRNASLGEQEGLLVADADSSEALLTLLTVINNTTEVCLFPKDPQRHRHIHVSANLCLRCTVAPDPKHYHTLHWVREVGGGALSVGAAHEAMDTLRKEYFFILDMMYRKPFLTKPTTNPWFAAEQLATPQHQVA